jgi:hypothetical protein
VPGDQDGNERSSGKQRREDNPHGRVG